ncbi:Por secretion system C-terminal sorting domain-containing protein [Chryseobacterium ureilyticum]|uniref:Por secretion system C-terminal sorting domain-containing protein n=1 Tax=Chryseobacterium ureilyticum TaxID=373668 RepID=A0A1N7K5V4_9FLAO|nr:PKD domain-containing protein [Chryseobacterium ureilyticum]SIS56993.1 Por secretion system C-terminal sorting domain-containing protein [Chryseobacterium ureilyticum]
MKNTTYVSRQLVFGWLLLCWLLIPWGLRAQTSTIITWDSQVGCQEFRGEKGEDNNETSTPSIKPGDCVRVCAGSTVKYTLNGSNVSKVEWTASGGNLSVIPATGSTQVKVAWGDPGSGSVQAVITFTDGNVETQNICIEKMNSPIADFKLMNLEKFACKNTEIHFDNLSQQNGGADIINYFWDFGDGTTSTAFEPSHSYSSPGIKTIKLTVTNKCGCSSTTERDIEILESPPVQINCASVVCEGSVEKYSVEDGCREGKWEVIGGTIMNNYGKEIEVRWDHVDPSDGFGYVMYKSECGCPEWTTIKIPVILKNAKIKGEEFVCTNKQYKYSLPQWPTTDINWKLYGPGGGYLTYNQQRNEILFTATQPGNYTLEANYTNTLLFCKGETKMSITVEEPVVISGGADEICKGANQTFTATPNMPVVWKVTRGGTPVNITQPVGGGPLTYNFPIYGSYVITAINQGGGCESKPIFIKVVETPDAPKGPIIGDELICPGKPYIYKLDTVPPGRIPVWSVGGGTIQGSNTGNSVTVVFNSGPSAYEVAVRYRTLGTAACLSSELSMKVKPIDLKSISIKPNPGPFCPSSTQKFTAILNGIVPDFMEWKFTDSPNFGSFVSGQGTADVVVNLNEVSGNVYGTRLYLRIVKCGQERIIFIPVSKLKLPVINFTNVGKICLGSPITFTVDQGTITSASGVTFTFANNSTYTTTFNASGTYTIPNGYIQNNTGADISQSVTVTYSGTNGCKYKPTATANFIILPETKITISPVYNIGVCDPNLFNYTFTANSSTGLTNIQEWQWFHDGLEILGANSNSYTIGGGPIFGVYKVRAKDINGCIVYSQDITVFQSCGTGTGCTVPPKVLFEPQWTGCNTISVNNLTYNLTPDEIQWGSDSVLTLVSAQGQNTAQYQTNLAGAHIVTVRLRYGSCWYSFTREVKKHYEPKFNISQTCNGNGYNVTLHNTSTIFDIDPNAINYSFSGTGLPVQNGQTVTYNNLAPGTYTFTMTMSAPSVPNTQPCTITQTITLKPIPSTNFFSPVFTCMGSVNMFTAGSYDPANIYTWYFDGTAYIAPGATANITYNTAGPKTIRLEVKTPQGCVYSSADKNITVISANFGGSLTPPNLIACEGSVPAIVHNPSLGFPTQYIWMNGSQPVNGAPNSMSFTPTQSGSYWPVMVSLEGCRDYSMSVTPAVVTIKTAPYVSILGKSNICAGSSATLAGIVTDNTLEYQWSIGSTILGPWTLATSPISYITPALSAGTYTYTLQVRNPGAGGCIASKNFTVTVSNPPSVPNITYTLAQCQPYTVQLTASGPSVGEYNWSNGMTGQTITVNEGGAYEVIYTAPSGCKVSSQVVVPLSLESLMWVFPTGCYDECPDKERKILGPKGIFKHHDWQLFTNNIQSGTNDVIHPLNLDFIGTYKLKIENFGCEFSSGPMNYYPSKDCGIEYDCRLVPSIETMKWEGDHYVVLGSISNGGWFPMSVTVSSLNGYGAYVPSIITIPGGGTYDFSTNPLLFYPNASFPGGMDEILFASGDCKVVAGVQSFGKTTVANPEITAKIKSESSLKIMPNPAKEKAKISYNTGSERILANQITVFDARGTIKYRKELKAASGEVELEVSDWLQGVYIVIVQTGDVSLQGKLIKN